MRSYELEQASIDKTFDLRHLQAIHKHLYQDVYEWAGEIRQVNSIKGCTRFLSHSLIEGQSQNIFNQLKQENYLKGLDADNFSKNAAYYLGEINHIHPFLEGNGHTQREFINQLAHHNGHHIEWRNVTRQQMIDASIEVEARGQLNKMVNLIRENLVDHNRLLAISQSRSYGGEHTKIVQAEAGKKYDGSIIGVTERHVMQASINSPSQVTIHNRHSLSRTPDMNKTVEISYPHGGIGLVREPEIVKEKDASNSWNLEKKPYQHEENEWER